jgi:hypothetical protein
MSEELAEAPAEVTIEAVVIRCGCGDPTSHAGAVCPRPRAREDLGRLQDDGTWEKQP